MVYYIGSIEKNKNNGETLRFYDKLEKEEYEKLDTAYCTLKQFTSIYNYYKMVEENRKELYKAIKKSKTNEEISCANYMSYEKSTVYNINRLTINFVGIFYSYINNIEYDISREYGKNSLHYEKLQEITNRYFEYNFEYRFLYRLRNYCIHHDLPINQINYTIGTKLKDFAINSNILMEHPEEWKHLETDFMSRKTISLYDVVNNFQNLLLNFNKEISLINKKEIVEAMLLLARYIYIPLDNTLLIMAESEEKLNNFDRVVISNFSEIAHYTEYILDELGISYTIK